MLQKPPRRVRGRPVQSFRESRYVVDHWRRRCASEERMVNRYRRKLGRELPAGDCVKPPTGCGGDSADESFRRELRLKLRS